MTVLNENGFIASELKSIASFFNMLDKAPNGQATDYNFTKTINTCIKMGSFDGGASTDIPMNKFTDRMKEVSTTQKMHGQTLLHSAINAPIPMPNAFRFMIGLARERGELQDALLSTNTRNQTVHESIQEYVAVFKQSPDEVQADPNLQLVQKNIEQCLETLANAENHLAISHKWSKEPNPARLLA